MARSKKRGHKNNGRARHDDMPEPSVRSPLNMFFGGHRYAPIPETDNQPEMAPAASGIRNEYFSSSPPRLEENNILIDIDPPPQRTLTALSDANTMYNSDVETASQNDSIEGDVCFPTPSKREDEAGIDYEALEQYVLEEQQEQLKFSEQEPQNVRRRRRLSNVAVPDSRRFSFYGDRMKHPGLNDSDMYRITYYSPAEASTIHARTISEIPSKNQRLSDMLKKGCFWIDVLNPTDAEMRALGKIFRIHPLTCEDIIMEEQREKCEVFLSYYFICFRSFEPDQYSASYLQPLGLYILVLKEGILTFHFRPMPHPQNVRKRIKQLKDYINVTPDWVCYGLLDDITDSFAPLIRAIEFEVDSIDELVLILKESEQSDMLRRIGYCRKRMMGLLRLLVSKADVVKTLVKRGEARPMNGTRPALSNEVALYLGDVQDHIITMLQSLNHYEKISSRSHSNYLAQISIEMTQTNNEINDILSKLTALGSVLIPMNLVTGLWGMNVQVPGQYQEDLTWFSAIMASILTFCIASTMMMRYYNIV
ncbi:CorA metal ion transporter [Apophysomyces sp. BC1034]|nr:CorA metal ion transporter [Apophysomyces sp. BC1015]KAG0182710.1 CorA metal ion transporter [Apophysomyces sp. BC1021]KAG0191882.1 CorA metal ion transporter [Apophysomyces sp. BC1034]